MPVYAYILTGIAALILLLIVVVSLRPAAFEITRTATIAAPPAAVFAQVNDFRNWDAWSPWAKIDPAMTQTYDGPAVGVGAGYAWKGNSKAGQGRMTITDSVPAELVRITLEFLKPMKATNLTEFAFASAGGGTTVTWTMTGTNGFVGKLFWLLLNLDKMVGKDFEKGLASMKAVAEASGTPSRRAA